MFLGVEKLLPTLKQVYRSPAKKNYQVNSQIKAKPRIFLSKGRPIRRGAVRVAAIVILLSFFLNYQPTLTTWPPFRQNIVRAEFEQVQSVKAEASPLSFKLPHLGYLSTPYSNYHPGIDIASGLGMPVKPIAPGKITRQGYDFWGLGLVIEVDHGHGFKSIYAHLGKIYVKQDQEVTPESSIGEVGLTGHTSGPHTHLEIYRDGKATNPQLLLPELPSMPIIVASQTASGSGKLN